MKKLHDIPNKEIMALLNCNESRASQIRNGHVAVSWKIAQRIHEEFGVPLWEINQEIYPQRIFTSHDTHAGNQ